MNLKAAWREATWIFLLSRLVILLFSFLSVILLPRHHIGSPVNYVALKRCDTTLNCFLLAWWHSDAVHYVEVAYVGYVHHTPLSVFFPIFPLLIRGLGMLFGGSIIADYAAGIFIANMCFYGALVLFYQLLYKDFGHAVARYALIYLAFAPYGLFFFAGYTESLFLLLSLAVFFFLSRGQTRDWWLAGLCGCVAALTRATGIILLVPFLVLFVQRFGVPFVQKFGLSAILAMALVPAGLLIYMLYLWVTFGNPLIFHVEEAAIWQRYTTFPWIGIIETIKAISGFGPRVYAWEVADFTFTLVPLVTLVAGWKRLPLHYSLFSVAMVLFVLCEPCQYEGLLSVPRYLLVVFPIILIFALWSKEKHLTWQLMIPFILFFILNVIQFASGNWVA
jgi:hypothetical protein